RRPAVVAFELLLVVLCNYMAFWLRFDGDIPSQYLVTFLRTFLIVVAVRAIIFVPFRLYEGLWRYTSLWDLRNIVAAVALSSSALYVIIDGLIATPDLRYPRSIF